MKLEEKKKLAGKLLSEIQREEEKVVAAKLKKTVKVGDCYKFHNSYTGDNMWWLYHKVIKVMTSLVRTESIQFTSDNTLMYQPNDLLFGFNGEITSGYMSISRKEYDTARARILKKVRT